MLAASGLPFDNSPLDGDISLVGALLAVDYDEPAAGGDDRGSDDLGGTSAAIPAFRDLAVLPFDAKATAPRRGPPNDLDGTSAAIPVFVEPLPFAARPFEGTVDVSDVDPFRDLAGATPEPQAGEEPRVQDIIAALDDGDLDTTTAFLAIDLDLPDEPVAPATPGAAALPAAAPAPRPRLTLEQYASLTVELDRWPTHGAAILERYGLTDHAAERAAWAGVLAGPAERARFVDLCAAYRAWLASQR
jgi:hypothetical protein